jgi:hypothetical protein
MLEIDLNSQLADLLKRHSVNVKTDDQFVMTDLIDNVKFKARAVYQLDNGKINSRLDVMALSDKGEKIIECCGDYGSTIEEAIDRNFKNFCAGSLHPLLGAFGCLNPTVLDQITIEEWRINERTWKAHIGNLVPKIIGANGNLVTPPVQFFKSIEQGIHAQKLTNKLHWFRGYYSQFENVITTKEFLMDNEVVKNTDEVFNLLPVIPEIKFYSCRNFIILRNIIIN